MTVPGQQSVTQSGAFTYSIPIIVPPGTAGMAPTLSLNYSSQSGDGYEGWGWSLGGLPAITRCPQTVSTDGVHGTVGFNSSDRFCLDGQRLTLASGTYGIDGSTYNTQTQGFSKITAHGTAGSGPAWFEVDLPSGRVMQLGNTSNSAVLASGTSTVREWLVNQITDKKGNYLTVTYTPYHGDAYPAEIDYTGNSAQGVTPYNSVQFTYSGRTNYPLLYRAGSTWNIPKLLTHIKTYNGTTANGPATLVLDYQLTYEGNTSTARARLKTLKLCDTNGACLPTTTFGWQGGGAPVISSGVGNSLAQGKTLVPGDFNGDGLADAAVVNTSCPSGGTIYSGSNTGSFTAANMTTTYDYNYYASQHYSGPACFLGGAPAVGDFAGNGFSDIVFNQFGYNSNLLNNRAGSLTQATIDTTQAPYTLLGDFTGDGRMDEWALFVGQYGVNYEDLFGGNGDGTFTLLGQGTMPPSITLYPGDFNGNGCTEPLVRGGSGANYIVGECGGGGGAGLSVGGTFITGDFNGDGLTDVLVVDSSGANIYLSTGAGFTAAYPVSSSSTWSSYTIVTGDWNGDGKTDVALISQTSGTPHLVYQSTDTNFTQVVTIPNNNGSTTAVVADWNNDGSDDLWLKTATGSGDSEYFFYSTGSSTTHLPELITSINNGVGAVTTIKYDRLNNGTLYTKGTAATYPNKDVDGPYYAVSEIDAPNGIGGTHNVTYSYSSALADVTAPPISLPKSNLLTHGFLTFGSITATDQQTGISTSTNFQLVLPYLGMVSSQTVKSGSVTLSSATNTWASVDQGGGSNFVYLQKSVVAKNDLDGTALPTVTTNYTPDAYGNMTTIAKTVSDGSSQTVTNTFTNDTTNWILGELTESDINRVLGTSNLTRHRSFTPDSTTGITKQVVLESGVSTCNSGTSSCTLTAVYGLDSFGNRNSVTLSGSGITSRTSNLFFDTSGEFAVKFTDATTAQNATLFTYDPAFGMRTSVTDPNGVESQTLPDTFGRLGTAVAPDGNKAALNYTPCTSLPTGESCPSNAAFDAVSAPENSGGSANGAISVAYYDALGRVVANDVQGFGGTWIRTATQYDANGNVSQTSRPYFLTGGTPVWTTYQYDVLGRIQLTTYPYTKTDGTTGSATNAYCYHGLTSSVTNGNSQITTTVMNAQGLVSQVQQGATTACATVTATTSYVYDALGEATKITDSNGKIISNTFDIRGHKTATTTPDTGTWTYQYDVLDELTSQTDANSHVTTFAYDVLMRPTLRTEADLTTKWTYDTLANGIGKLASACTAGSCSSAAYRQVPTYDTLGRLSADRMTLDGTNYSYGTITYNSDGRVDTMPYPSGFVAKYHYDSYGYLTEIDDNSTSTPVWTAVTRDAELHLSEAQAGNGVTTDQTFDANTGNLRSVCATNDTTIPCDGNVLNQSYSWDQIGNLLTRSDTYEGWNEYACYDVDNRLTKWSLDGTSCTSGTDKKSITYGWNNIQRKTDACNTTNCYVYGGSGAGPYQLTSMVGTYNGVSNPTFAYDANGNMLAGAGRSFGWTSYNMLKTATDGATSASLEMAYGTNHQRYKMCVPNCTSPTTTTDYLYDPATGGMSEKVVSGSATTWKDYIVADGQIVAIRTKGTSVSWNYIAGDHLGSVTAVTDSTGSTSTEERDSYDAWGKRRNPDATDDPTCSIASLTTRGYTDQEMLDSMCLVNLNGRVYDPSLGLFISADDRIPDPYDFRSYNRYAYVNDNPLNSIDPSGHATPSENSPPTKEKVQCWNGCRTGSFFGSDPFDEVQFGYTWLSLENGGSGGNAESGGSLSPGSLGGYSTISYTASTNPEVVVIEAFWSNWNPDFGTENSNGYSLEDWMTEARSFVWSMLPHSIGVLAGGNFEAGNYFVGGSTQLSYGYGYFGQSGFQKFTSEGDSAQFFNFNLGYPNSNPNAFVAGVYYGAGAGGFLSNAENESDFLGPFHAYTISAGEGVGIPSFQVSWGYNSAGNLIWSSSFLFGPGTGLAFTHYDTVTTPGWH